MATNEYPSEIVELAKQLNVDPQTVQDALYSGRAEEELRSLDARQSYADALRASSGPQGRQVGGVYKAADPTEFLAQLLRAHYGGQETRRVSGARQDVLDRQAQAATATAQMETAARDDLVELIKSLRGEPTAPPASMPPPGGAAVPSPGSSAPSAGPPAGGTMPVSQPVPTTPPQGAPQPQGPRELQGPPLPPGAAMALRAQRPRQVLQGPPEPGWWDMNPARLAAKRRFNDLIGFEGFLRKDRGI